jgi:sec-independent protein translocase protein TatB
MFDISWSEFLLIGVVALIVIGPKELPAVMRTLGQWTRKVRSMAGEFQNQFQEAMREAEMTDLKKEVDDLARDVKNFDPLKDVREDFASVGEDVKRSLDTAPEQAAALPDASPAPALTEAPAAPSVPAEPASLPAAETAALAPPEASNEAPASDVKPVGAGVETATPQSVDDAAQAGGPGRTE